MDKVTCIVVGAGPAGSACALALARKGIETVLFERGRVPGEKNVASFTLYTSVLKQLIPDFRKDLPVERIVVRTDHVYLGPSDTKSLQSYNYRWADDPIAFTAFRRKFDAWLARKAVDAGVQLMSGMKVDDLIQDGDRVIGVSLGGQDRAYPIRALMYHEVVNDEVGGDPRCFGASPAGFHAANWERARRHPRAMLATSTHDTKRSEDVRAESAALTWRAGATTGAWPGVQPFGGEGLSERGNPRIWAVAGLARIHGRVVKIEFGH